MKRSLLTLARSPLGSFIVGVAFGRCSKFLPVDRVCETDYVLAFRHPKPHWEEHILIVPKKAIQSLDTIKTKDQKYITEIFHVVQEIIKAEKQQYGSYQLIINGGTRQDVSQLHVHLGFGKST